MTDSFELLAAKKKAEELLLLKGTLPVTGVGMSEKEDIINIYVTDVTEKVHRYVTEKLGGSDINGHERRYIKTGIIKSLQCPSCLKSYALKPLAESVDIGRTEYHRPIMGGDSISHPKISAGTLASLVYDATTKQPLMLSNNHILGASSSYSNQTAYKGDIIYAPGCWDSPGNICDPTYQIGKLERFVPFNEKELNFVDAAVALPDSNYSVSDEIRGLGKLTGHKKAEEGMSVSKSARTTGITSGRIMDVNATLETEYSANQKYTFTDVIVTGHMADSGDSGGALLESGSNKMTGMLFAGSDDITCFNKIENIMNSLNILTTPHDSMPSIEYLDTTKNIYDTVYSLGINVVGIGLIIGALPTIEQQIQLLLSRKS